jgi:hypothetical protein
MNDDQLYYFLVDKNTRNVMQIEYPSDIDEFNKILGTSEGKGNLLKDLGIILNNDSKVFENPKQKIVVQKPAKKSTKSESKSTTKEKSTKKTLTKKAEPIKEPVSGNLFAGLFD